MTAATAPRNGLRHGDISYLTVRVAATAKARAFCEPLFGWTFSPGDPSPRSQVGGVRPEMGIGEDGRAVGVVLDRLEDIAAAVGRVRSHGGTATDPDPVQRPYALEANRADDQGIVFYLHEFADGSTQTADLRNGARHGDVAYLSLGVPDADSRDERLPC